MSDIGLQKKETAEAVSRWTSISLKEAAAFLIFLLSGAGVDSDRRLPLAIMFLIAAAVLYGQAKEKEKDEKDNVVENSSAGDCSPGSS